MVLKGIDLGAIARGGDAVPALCVATALRGAVLAAMIAATPFSAEAQSLGQTPEPDPAPPAAQPTPETPPPPPTGRDRLTQAQAFTIQVRLKDLGFYNGPIDGDLGRGSFKAWREFGARYNLPTDNQWRQEHIDELNKIAAAGSGPSKNPTPPAKPEPPAAPPRTAEAPRQSSNRCEIEPKLMERIEPIQKLFSAAAIGTFTPADQVNESWVAWTLEERRNRQINLFDFKQAKDEKQRQRLGANLQSRLRDEIEEMFKLFAQKKGGENVESVEELFRNRTFEFKAKQVSLPEPCVEGDRVNWPENLNTLISQKLEDSAATQKKQWLGEYFEIVIQFQQFQERKRAETQFKKRLTDLMSGYIRALVDENARTDIFYQQMANVPYRYLMLTAVWTNDTLEYAPNPSAPAVKVSDFDTVDTDRNDAISKEINFGTAPSGQVYKIAHTELISKIDGETLIDAFRTIEAAAISQLPKLPISHTRVDVSRPDCRPQSLKSGAEPAFNQVDYQIQQYQISPNFVPKGERVARDDEPADAKNADKECGVRAVAGSIVFKTGQAERACGPAGRVRDAVAAELTRDPAALSRYLDFPRWFIRSDVQGAPFVFSREKARNVLALACEVWFENDSAQNKESARKTLDTIIKESLDQKGKCRRNQRTSETCFRAPNFFLDELIQTYGPRSGAPAATTVSGGAADSVDSLKFEKLRDELKNFEVDQAQTDKIIAAIRQIIAQKSDIPNVLKLIDDQQNAALRVDADPGTTCESLTDTYKVLKTLCETLDAISLEQSTLAESSDKLKQRVASQRLIAIASQSVLAIRGTNRRQNIEKLRSLITRELASKLLSSIDVTVTTVKGDTLTQEKAETYYDVAELRSVYLWPPVESVEILPDNSQIRRFSQLAAIEAVVDCPVFGGERGANCPSPKTNTTAAAGPIDRPGGSTVGSGLAGVERPAPAPKPAPGVANTQGGDAPAQTEGTDEARAPASTAPASPPPPEPAPVVDPLEDALALRTPSGALYLSGGALPKPCVLRNEAQDRVSEVDAALPQSSVCEELADAVAAARRSGSTAAPEIRAKLDEILNSPFTEIWLAGDNEETGARRRFLVCDLAKPAKQRVKPVETTACAWAVGWR